MSCRLSKRGHAWQPPKLAAQRLRPAPHVRICECGAIGYVNRHGVVEIDWEPAAIGAIAGAHPCDREEVRRAVLAIADLESAAISEYRDTLVDELLRVLR